MKTKDQNEKNTFLAASDHLRFLVGNLSEYFIDMGSKNFNFNQFIDKIKNNYSSGEKCIIAVRLKRIDEFASNFITPKTRFQSNGKKLTTIVSTLDLAGFSVLEKIAVFPNFNFARFFFPFDDFTSHRFLFQYLLIPRRYSLPILIRILLHMYTTLLKLIGDSSFLYQHVYLIVKKL